MKKSELKQLIKEIIKEERFQEPEKGSDEWQKIADEAQEYYAEGSTAAYAADQMRIPIWYMREIYKYLKEDQ